MTLLLALPTPSLLAEADILKSRYLSDLAAERNFEITGLTHLTDDSLAPPADANTEQLIARVLRRYDHLVFYSNGEVTRVEILGRKPAGAGSTLAEYEASLPTADDPAPEQ